MVVPTKTDRLGKYRLDAVIGEGAMGVVYRAFDEDIERPVAIKVLHSHLLNDDMGAELATRFRLEAKAAARCMHTHIVTVFDYGVSDNAHYIVMEFIEGVDLRTLLRQEKRIPFRQASDTIFQVLSALEHAHKNGVVHRDIKPANIMILDSGQVKVADFGVARLASSEMTQVGYIIGTPSYMSPEGRMGLAVDNRSDLYAVAIVFYEILTGKRPKLEKPDSAISEQDILEVIEDPLAAAKISGILRTALEGDPQQRFASAEEFSRQLGAVLSPDHRHVPDTEELAATVLRTARKPIEDLRAQVIGSRPHKETTQGITPSVIEQLEKSLVVYVGPMASLLVKKYAKECENIDALLDALIKHIPNDNEQSEFRTAVNVSGLTQITGADQPPPGKAPPDGAPSVILNQEQIQEIGSLLAQFIGPLASRIVRRGQQEASDRADFCNRLAERIARDEEKTLFLRKLNKLL